MTDFLTLSLHYVHLHLQLIYILKLLLKSFVCLFVFYLGKDSCKVCAVCVEEESSRSNPSIHVHNGQIINYLNS